ncbi:olfactory receptor 7A5-like isoform X2 [Macrotis lagotis]|uniref:olfactory receptor 7A5-like isoform X2 n=1 Tax=Macrotis lagotis TaxID=92651 RepID=UPI003D681C04
MVPENQTQFTEFILLLFSEKPNQEAPLFGLFLSMYLVTMIGNLLIMLAISSDSHLHTPMYFLISNLSFVDTCLVTTTVPRMLVSFRTQNKAIPYADCLTQMFFFILFAGIDNFLLTSMAYDRFVAICHPLRYAVMMSSWFCGLLVILCWTMAFLVALLFSLLGTRLSFCTNQQIQHFFCDLPEIMKLSCSDTLINYILMYLVSGLLGVIPVMGILFSYIQICSSIIKIQSAQGKYKAFSTCGSHLCVVSLFYGTVFGVYLSSAFTDASWKSTVASAIYAVVTPMLNPFIYTLRNKDIKAALKIHIIWG